MSTREDLLDALRGDSDDCYCGGPYCSGPEELVDKFAHELAESQRAAEAQWRASGYEGVRPKGWLMDLIDPEVEK